MILKVKVILIFVVKRKFKMLYPLQTANVYNILILSEIMVNANRPKPILVVPESNENAERDPWSAQTDKNKKPDKQDLLSIPVVLSGSGFTSEIFSASDKDAGPRCIMQGNTLKIHNTIY